MRKRRAMVFGDESGTVKLLRSFFVQRGYEVAHFHEPWVCPVYGSDRDACCNMNPCADVMLADLQLPNMNCIELLQRQKARGCKIVAQNKATLATGVSGELKARAERLDCRVFDKLLLPTDLGSWLAECEKRAPVSTPVCIERSEPRHPVRIPVSYLIHMGKQVFTGMARNLSDSGFCLETTTPLARHERIWLSTELPIGSRIASVRWLSGNGNGAFHVGFWRDDVPQ